MSVRTFDWAHRAKGAGVHLGLSLLVAGLSAALVFGLWYPWPYRQLSGGWSLFTLIVSVDVVTGPLLTFAVFRSTKRRAEKVRDLAVIGCLQLAALGYGVWALWQARPVHMVFEVDRMRVVSAADIEPAALEQAPADLRRLPVWRPTLIAARRPDESSPDFLEALDAAMSGRDLALQPKFWAAYGPSEQAQALRRAQPFTDFLARKPDSAGLLQAALAQSGLSAEQARVLPVLSRLHSWVAILDADGRPVAYAAVDGF